MSEPLYGDPYDLVHRLKIVDIATGASEVKPVQEKMQGSETLGWIRPNLWKGGTLMFFKGLLLEIHILGQAVGMFLASAHKQWLKEFDICHI